VSRTSNDSKNYPRDISRSRDMTRYGSSGSVSRDYSRDRYRDRDRSNSSKANLRGERSFSNNNLVGREEEEGKSSYQLPDRPTLQRQGTFTETRKARPFSAEFCDPPARPPGGHGGEPGRPLSGPPLVQSSSHDSDGGAKRKTSFSRQLSDNTKPVTRLQVNPGIASVVRDQQSKPVHTGCFSRSSPSPTFARKYRGSPGRGRMI